MICVPNKLIQFGSIMTVAVIQAESAAHLNGLFVCLFLNSETFRRKSGSAYGSHVEPLLVRSNRESRVGRRGRLLSDRLDRQTVWADEFES